MKKLALLLTLASTLMAAGGDVAPSVDDRQIVLQIRNQMGNPKFRGVTLTVIKGVVTINGKVPTENDIAEMDNIVNNVPGVQNIVNRLRLSTAPKAALPPNNMTLANSPIKPQDTYLTTADYLILFTLRNQLGSTTTYDHVTIGVASGVVTLQGTVATQVASDNLANAARIITGVTTVINNIETTASVDRGVPTTQTGPAPPTEPLVSPQDALPGHRSQHPEPEEDEKTSEINNPPSQK